MRYFAKIKYLGTNFHGFQVQPSERTVQGTLCDALFEALGCKASVTGCSRTDAGVHANEFCLVIDAPGATVPADKLPVAIARFLPNDLSLFLAKECDFDFHPISSCITLMERPRSLPTPAMMSTNSEKDTLSASMSASIIIAK